MQAEGADGVKVWKNRSDGKINGERSSLTAKQNGAAWGKQAIDKEGNSIIMKDDLKIVL